MVAVGINNGCRGGVLAALFNYRYHNAVIDAALGSEHTVIAIEIGRLGAADGYACNLVALVTFNLNRNVVADGYG